ncbi:hypothetical protein ACE193_07630 [Bernardetia sp. OM2101]|uniref:hypothetical protein n=1 Tax=Bernardetia sp. OM2101 TaxID=3344876 RepID=UPI0035CE88A9
MKYSFYFLMFFLSIGLFSCLDNKEDITQETVVLPFLKKQAISSEKLPTKITNRKELETVLNFHYKKIFSKIPAQDLAAFIETVEYNERGITTFRFDYLKKNVSEEDLRIIYETLFIMKKKSAETIKGRGWNFYECPFVGYRCYGPGSCLKADGDWICTCNC